MRFQVRILLCLSVIFSPSFGIAQQLSDPDYLPPIPSPAYPTGSGPIVLIDAGHHNFHTAENRYKPFAKLLQRDGYRIKSHLGQFSKAALEKSEILVISNAQHEDDVNNWHTPNQSAFTKNEIVLIENWVRAGGSVFLIADHMPMGGAIKELAAAFGFACTDGFAIDTTDETPSLFSMTDGNLSINKITVGRNAQERTTMVATFTGQAFRCPPDATSIIDLDQRFINFLPDSAWVFHENTKRISADGWSQGAFKTYGQGRVVIFGEAAMFSAQLSGPNRRKMGMNHPNASQNFQLLLNIIHWLDRLID